jgi:hypothetical protein
LKEIGISGSLRTPEPVLLSSYDAEAYWTLVDAFEQRKPEGYEDADALLPPVRVYTKPDSGLVIGRYVDERDTVYVHEPGILGFGTSWSSTDTGSWVRGTEVYSLARYGAHTDDNIDGHDTLMLESLDNDGNPLPGETRVGVEVDLLAINALWIARLDWQPESGNVFDPQFYLSHK